MNSVISRGASWIGRNPWKCVLGCLGMGFAVCLWGIASCFWLSHDASALSRELRRQTGGVWNKKIEVRAGPILCGLARMGLGWAPMPPEAREALQVVRWGEAGVYQAGSRDKAASPAALVAAADATMVKHGWDRVVTVSQRDNLVLVYVPQATVTEKRFTVCVAVWSGRQMVVASVRANMEPVIRLALDPKFTATWSFTKTVEIKPRGPAPEVLPPPGVPQASTGSPAPAGLL